MAFLDYPDAGQMPCSAQLILGTDKRNPLFTVYRDSRREKVLVYYGFELMEVLPEEPNHPAFKLMIARLYNAGIKAKSLCEAFAVDLKTIRRWARALLCADAQNLIRVLEGPSARRKFTVQVEAFVRMRWPEVTAGGAYGAVGRLREEIKAVFRVDISAVTLRPLIRQLKVQSAIPCPPSAPADSPGSAPPMGGGDPEEKREQPCGSSPLDADASKHSNSLPCTPLDTETPLKPPLDNRNHAPVFPSRQPEGSYWCDHAGVLIFAPILSRVTGLFDPSQGLLSQWLASLWLGALNIEQTKFLNWEDLEGILGSVVRFPSPQRERLKALATDATVEELLRFNLEESGQGQATDFYFDPHSKHYTGEQNVLKGWCPKIRWADKVLHSDFIHTARGTPIYFETTDNFEDLRTRFFGVTARARSILRWPAERVVSYVVDRGIFGSEVFEKVLQDPSLHLITWQKGFVAEAWGSSQANGKLVMTRARNSSTDLRSYRFDYLDRDWAADPRLRQIVVQAMDPNGRVIQVAILTEDRQRGAEEIIRLMFQRWLQENDFKYLDKHFGINQITSYRVLAYETLRNQVQDRDVKSAERKAIEARKRSASRQQSQLLLAQERADYAARKRQQACSQLQQQLSQLAAEAPGRAALTQKISRMETARQRHEKSSLQRRTHIESWNQTLEQLEQELAASAATASRLETMITAEMVRMEPHSKRLMDTLRILARNQFYNALQPFKAAYDNYRDDHDYFRQLTQSPGVLEVGKETIRVHLLPQGHYGSEMKRIVNGVLHGINQQGLAHPATQHLKLIFRLGQRSEMKVKMEWDV